MILLSERCDWGPPPWFATAKDVYPSADTCTCTRFLSRHVTIAQVRPLSTAEKAAKARHRVFIQRPGVVQMRALRFGGSTAGQDDYVFETDRVYMMAGKEHAAQLFQEMVAPAITGSFLQGVNTLVPAPTSDDLLLPCDVVPSRWSLLCSHACCVQILLGRFCSASLLVCAASCLLHINKGEIAHS